MTTPESNFNVYSFYAFNTQKTVKTTRRRRGERPERMEAVRMKRENKNIDGRVAELEKRYIELEEQQICFRQNFKDFTDSMQEKMTELRLVLQEIRKKVNS